MGAMDYLSSLHWLDLLSALITLAAEFVAIFYLDEDAHSPIWFFLLLTMMPALSAIFGAIATCTSSSGGKATTMRPTARRSTIITTNITTNNNNITTNTNTNTR